MSRKLIWHEFAGGTGAPPDKHSYQAVTGGINGREMYLIDPLATARGNFLHYIVRYFGVGGYHQLGTTRVVNEAKRIAQAHFGDDPKRNPRRSILADHAAAIAPKRNPRNPRAFSVVVGNIGHVHEGNNYMKARAIYNDYVKQSKSNIGRASGEPVTLFHGDEIKAEYFGTLEENPTRRRNPAKRKSNYRIAVQAQLGGSLWMTISAYPDTEAGKNDAIAEAKKIHTKVPDQAMRVMRVKRK